MDLSLVGERDVISSIVSSTLDAQSSMVGDVLGMKDDCAALDMGDHYLVVSTDTVNAGTHFPRGSPWDMAGWYSAAVNLSDVAAMGAEPLGIVMAYGLPLEMTPSEVSEMTSGVTRCATEFGAPILGGDTKRHRVPTVTGTALGRVGKDQLMPREAKGPLEEGDTVAVTGTLGGAAAGCHVTSHIMNGGNPIRDRKEYVEALERVLLVRPRVPEGIALSGSGRVKAAMDLSDGLARSLHTLGEMNDCGFRLRWDDVPLDDYAHAVAKKYDRPPKEFALYYGGDFELVVVVGGGEEGFTACAEAVRGAGGTLTAIGSADPDGVYVLEGDGGDEELEDRGWEHFFSE